MEYLRPDSTRSGWAQRMEACISLSSSSEDLVTGQRNLGWGAAVGVFKEGVCFPMFILSIWPSFFVGFAAWISWIFFPHLKHTYVHERERLLSCGEGSLRYMGPLA